jgi:acetolactate synthase-1/2/3 large subunit
METLYKMGYTQCFYVAGGNSMHLLESASRYLNCTPVVHEVTAGIAAEYFNQSGRGKAFALVTAGPGVTNLMTSVAGAWLDSRELLIVGGQVKTENLKKNGIRQGGIQEIDGISLLNSISKKTFRIDALIDAQEISRIVEQSYTGRPGPVFIEVCLDISAADHVSTQPQTNQFENNSELQQTEMMDLNEISRMISQSKRPLVLLGSGIARDTAFSLLVKLKELKIPVATTWSGADRVNADYPFYAGRPNNYGMRWANIFQQQADLLITIGSSLGLQQTGFNIESYMPVGKIVHIDIDESELSKQNPGSRVTLKMDSAHFAKILPSLFSDDSEPRSEWINFLSLVKSSIPFVEPCQLSTTSYLSPHSVIYAVSKLCSPNAQIVICSSGGTFTAGMQCFENKGNQILISNKGLASMGYGLAGAIGLAISNNSETTLLFEGDGGFAQNMQDLGTVVANKLRLKIFITNNQGYASIRTSQKNYFKGHYLGCDTSTGLGFPNWSKIADSYGITHFPLNHESLNSPEFVTLLDSTDPVVFEIFSDPEQVYLPRVHSSVMPNGQMNSSAIHDMLPKLSEDIAKKVFKYIPIPE